jgi:SAM-dependent methyltransferase
VSGQVERDDGFIEAEEPLRYFASEPWNELEAWALGQVSGRVLDIGAGAGRVALAIQGRGQAVVALDTSPAAIEVCRRRGVRETFLGTVYDLAHDPARRFDSFALFGGNLALLSSREEAHRFLGMLRQLAAPGARIIGGCIDPYQTDVPEHIANHAANRAAGRMAGSSRIRYRYRALATPWFDILFVSPAELEELTAATAWRVSEIRRDGPAYAAVLSPR